MPELIFHSQVLNNHIRHIHHARFYGIPVLGLVNFFHVFHCTSNVQLQCKYKKPDQGQSKPQLNPQLLMAFKVLQIDNKIIILRHLV